MKPHHLKALRTLCRELRSVLEDPKHWRRRQQEGRDGARWSRRLLTLRCLQARRLISESELPSILSRRANRCDRDTISEDKPAGLDEAIEDAFESLASRLPSVFTSSTKSSPTELAARRCFDLVWNRELDDVFKQGDALCWAHQIWNEGERQQLYRKVLHNSSEKIEGQDLVTATQLYTPEPIARFLVQNSLGALWASLQGAELLSTTWDYFVRGADRSPGPKGALGQLTIIDPSCGAGNLLLEAFDLLYELYRWVGQEQSEETICRSILEHDLYGLDLDQEAVEVARAVLWMRAAERAPTLPEVRANLCCLFVELDDPEFEVRAFLERIPSARPHRLALQSLFETLARLGDVGSLVIDAELDVLMGLTGHQWFTELESFVAERFGSHHTSPLQGLQWLARRHDVVIANPPFLSNRQMGGALRRYIQSAYRDTSEDLYACFLRRMEQLTTDRGFYALVSPQGWTTLKSFAAFRKRWLEENRLTCFVALGQRTFAEAQLLYIGLAAAQRIPPSSSSTVTAIRLDGQDRQAIWHRLQALCKGGESHRLPQHLLSRVPLTPISPFVPTTLLELLADAPVLIGDRADVVAGIDTGENIRCVRYHWEVSKVHSDRFKRYSKGKGYQRWAAPNPWVVDWGREGERVKLLQGSTIRNARHHFHEGLEYSYVYGGKVSCRQLEPSILDHGSAGIFASSTDDELLILALLNSRLGTYIGRTLSPTLNLSVGCVKRFPFPLPTSKKQHSELVDLARACVALKSFSLERRVSNDGDHRVVPTLPDQPTLDEVMARSLEAEAASAAQLVLEAVLERTLSTVFGLGAEELDAIFAETGAPPATPLALEGMNELPPRPAKLERDLSAAWDLAKYHTAHSRVAPALSETLEVTRRRVKELYDDAGKKRRHRAMSRRGGHGSSPLPCESFTELASSSLALHPFSTYWLLHEGVLRQRWGAERAERNAMLGWAHDVVLQLLDRGPLQAGEPSAGGGVLVVASWSSDQPLYTLLTGYDERFREVVGTSLPDWVETSFFKTHIRRFAKRPIAWQLQSSPTRPGASPAFICLVDGRVVNAETLPRLRDKVIGPLREQIASLSHRSRGNDETLTAVLDEVIELEAQLTEIITSGFGSESLVEGLHEESIDQYCSIDGVASQPADVEAFVRQESAYSPDPHDGVRVNIAPLERVGVLAAQVLEKNDVEKAIADRARYRSEERCWCRERLLTRPGWWPD